MRFVPTASEALLWKELVNGKLGVSFRRQVVIAGYICDFVCAEARLVVEVDGGYHAGRRRADARRDRALARAGYRVVRLDIEIAHTSIAIALKCVREVLQLT
jgi:very-short-patch-repair endonuclease